MNVEPTQVDRDLARNAVALVLRDQEAAWEPVARLIAGARTSPNQRRHNAPGQKAGYPPTHNAGGPAVDVAGVGGRVPMPLDKNGVPLRAEDWTEEDWRDLYRTTKRVIRKIARRHRTAP